MITLRHFAVGDAGVLVEFMNRNLAPHRHWAPITEADFSERVLEQPAFDPKGLILAWNDGALIGAVHAVKPPPPDPIYATCDPAHTIVWLAVDQAHRGQQAGTRLLGAAEDYLYYCPVHFAAHDAPLYGILEALWAPWYGSTERMAVSAVNDRPLIDWLGRRGYGVVNPGDVSLVAPLHGRERPVDPGLAAKGLRIAPISERSPWQGDERFYRLRGWGRSRRRRYHGLVVADGEHAVGEVVWYPLPDNLTAALASIDLERQYRGLRFGSYLLDRALTEMASRGYLYVEVHVHTKDNPEAFAMYRRRGFQVLDYWVNLVKT